MPDIANHFAINTYSYTLDTSAADCLRRLSDQGYQKFELMMFPGHLWPSELTPGDKRDLFSVIETRGLEVFSVNMPNIDINIAAASSEMRDYSLSLLRSFTQFAGEIGAKGIIVGPGKGNPLFPAPQEQLVGRFFKALDELAPLAEQAGTSLFVENMPFAFLPRVVDLMQVLDQYSNDDIGVIYDAANGYFINEDICAELRACSSRLKLIHLSDTAQKVYKHDAVGLGDLPFSVLPDCLSEIGYSGPTMLEIISQNADKDIKTSCQKLYDLGFR